MAKRQIASQRDIFLDALSKMGSVELARNYTGITKEELSKIDDASIVAAKSAFEKYRIDSALKLINRSRDIALLTENVSDMLTVAGMLAPELVVHPQESARARAKAEHASPQTAIQINVGMAELGERLQEALRKQSI